MLAEIVSCYTIDEHDDGFVCHTIVFSKVVKVVNDEAWVRDVQVWEEDGVETILCGDAQVSVVDPDEEWPSGPSTDAYFEATAPDLETAIRWLVTGSRRGLDVIQDKRRPKLGDPATLIIRTPEERRYLQSLCEFLNKEVPDAR